MVLATLVPAEGGSQRDPPERGTNPCLRDIEDKKRGVSIHQLLEGKIRDTFYEWTDDTARYTKPLELTQAAALPLLPPWVSVSTVTKDLVRRERSKSMGQNRVRK